MFFLSSSSEELFSDKFFIPCDNYAKLAKFIYVEKT